MLGHTAGLSRHGEDALLQNLNPITAGSHCYVQQLLTRSVDCEHDKRIATFISSRA
jgi:hypothetical protein